MSGGHDRHAPREPGQLPVDVGRDRRARVIQASFLAGPVIWIAHFMVVYLVAEAGCTGGGPGLRAFNPPVPEILTLVATAVAAAACLASAVWGYRRWRSAEPSPETDGPGQPVVDEHVRSLAFAGLLLSALSLVAVLFVGLPAAILTGC